MLCCFSLTFTFAQVVVDEEPALAFRLAPYDGRITAAYATALAGPDATVQDRARADTLASQALGWDATSAGAVATLGINADVRGDEVAARRLFTYAQKLSRRDLRTQMFMIEDAVQRDNISGALHQYDITLRVFPKLSEMLYPVLASASTDPGIRRELTRTLAGKPVWSESFVNFVATYNADPKSTALLFVDLRRSGTAIPQTAEAGAVNALLSNGELTAAWSYYAQVRPGADRRRSRDPGFSANLETPSRFDWIPVNDGPGVVTSIQDGIFDFDVPAIFGGAILQQAQMLPPGIYRLNGHSVAIEQAAGTRLYWTLRCENGRELGRIEVPNSSIGNGDFAGTFNVPTDCPLQTLVLTVRPSDAVSGLSGQMDRVALVPAR